MSKINKGFVAIIGAQSGLGSVNTTIRDATGALDLTDGLILGDADSGIVGSGISVAFGNNKLTPANVVGSYTKNFAGLLEETVTRLSFAVPFGGPRQNATATPQDDDGDFGLSDRYAGMNALLGCAGLVGAAHASLVGWKYSVAPIVPATAKFWFYSGTSCVAVVLYDIVTDLTAALKARQVGLFTFDAKARFYSRNKSETFPTGDFGVVASITPPKVGTPGSNHVWGQTRGFSEATFKIANSVEEIDDSNATGGYVVEQTDREVTVDTTMYADDGDESYDFDRVGASSATTDDVSLVVGTPMVGGSPVNAYRVDFANPDHLTAEPAELGSKGAVKVSARATGTTANSEFSITVL